MNKWGYAKEKGERGNFKPIGSFKGDRDAKWRGGGDNIKAKFIAYVAVGVADPDPFDMDPDPVCHFVTDPNLAFQFVPDPYRFEGVMYLIHYCLYICT
jgi:hypothetical protein